MMNEPTITVSGNVTRDPERRVGKESGNDFAVVPIAVNRRKFDRTQEAWVTSDTTYVDLLAFGPKGATALASFKKGDPVIAHGRVTLHEWQTESSAGARLVVDVDSLGHDVSLGVSRFSKGWVSYDGDRSADYDPSPQNDLVGAVDRRADGEPEPDIAVDEDGVVQDDQQADAALARSA
ncbi:single-strand binding protein [Serinicoccus hydrothermalis]|uniref:Single-strand binding protein n=1 Tax=Serinicoccus hydrothermalis TaxID=1758689 RepID=A0A1B1NAT9_9MICO|nr:single-stranded DNA-binding protein [Serinicoccus hydrothermalis]ANS78547.1 single-strand binding protein [Serinicoccus hydrothermalis]